jgi:hypothetical protein
VHNVSDIRQIEVHTSEILMPDPNPLEIEIAIANLEKAEGSDQILLRNHSTRRWNIIARNS